MHWFVKFLVVLGIIMLTCIIITGFVVFRLWFEDKRERNMTVGDRMRECSNETLALLIAKIVSDIDPGRNWIDDKYKIKKQLDEKIYK